MPHQNNELENGIDFDTISNGIAVYENPYGSPVFDPILAGVNQNADWLNHPGIGLFISPNITPQEFNDTVQLALSTGFLNPETWVQFAQAKIQLIANSGYGGDTSRVPDATITSIVNAFSVASGAGAISHLSTGAGDSVDPNFGLPDFDTNITGFSFSGLTESFADSFQSVVDAPGAIFREAKGTIAIVAIAVIAGAFLLLRR